MTSVKRDTRSEGFVGGALSTHLYEMSYPEVPGLLRIVRGYILTEAMITN